MSSPEKFLRSFADFIQRRHTSTLYPYAGYTGLAGSLLLKVKDSDKRVAIRPWLRNRPVGLVDIVRSDNRYQSFRGQAPDIYVHVGTHFRDNAIRNARRSDASSLIMVDSKRPEVGIIQASNMPRPVLDALLSFCGEAGFKATYDFTGTLVHSGFKGEIAQAGRLAARARNPRLFLSYSWDGDDHRRWVLKLAADLIRNGIHVLIDEWDLHDYNHDLHLFMETGIRESDFVLLVCTPEYAKRADSRKGGVGVESTIITGEFYDPAKSSKFVPILRIATPDRERCTPGYLKSRYAIDFTNDLTYQVRLEELLRRVFGQPRYKRPNLGPIPEFGSEDV